MDIPDEVIEIIFGFLTFDEVSKVREVCTQFNYIAGKVLTEGFAKTKLLHTTCVKEIKEALPRRDSARRKHALYPRHDILQAVDTRLSLLSMSYNRAIVAGYCCFIPGKVLDELFRVLRLVRRQELRLPNTLELLQEVRDLSSMAMEHFDEYIEPYLPINDRQMVETRKSDSEQPVEPSSAFSALSQLELSDDEEKLLKKNEKNLLSLLTKLVLAQGRRIRQLSSNKPAANCNRKIKKMEERTQALENKIRDLTYTVHDMSNQVNEMAKKLSEVRDMKTALTSESGDADVSLDFNGNVFRKGKGRLRQNKYGKLMPGKRRKRSSSWEGSGDALPKRKCD